MKVHFEVIVGVLLLLGLSAVAAATPTIDGDLSDWGLGKLVTDTWASNDTWLPDPAACAFANNIQFVIEDNRDPRHGEAYPYSGIHIRGTGNSYSSFFEPLVQESGEWKIPPVGGEQFDIESVYLYQTNDNIYVAIVTSVDPFGSGGLRPGDLALNLDGDMNTGEYGYEYGVVVSTFANYPQGSIIKDPDWDGIGAITPENPDVIVCADNNKIVGNAAIIYDNSWMTFTESFGAITYGNWIIEIEVPKNPIGMTGKSIDINKIRYADNCLNDHIFVPEFPAYSLLIGILFGMAGAVYIVKSRKN